MTLNFKEIYKAANNEIHAPSGAAERVIANSTKKTVKLYPILKICTAAAAVIAVTLSSFYMYGIETKDDTVKLMKIETPVTSEDEFAKNAVPNETESTAGGEILENQTPTVNQTPSISAKSENQATVQNSTPVPTNEVASETPQFDKAAEIGDTVIEKNIVSDSSVDDTQPSGADDTHEPQILCAATGNDSKEAAFNEVSYDEYCREIGYDVISKAVLPEGVTLVCPDSLYVDGNQNPNTFYTTSENSKECYITVSVNANENKNTRSVTQQDDVFEIQAASGNVSVSAQCHGFTESEVNELSRSLSE